MISVLTITYGRPELLEEAIYSFMLQCEPDCNMVIVNDDAETKYNFPSDKILVCNLKNRFSSILKKLEFGFKLCKHDYIYRLDDDDLLQRGALKNVKESILENPGFDVYRSSHNHWFTNNKIVDRGDNVNNGNIYTKSYLDRVNFRDESVTEDQYLTFGHDAKICSFDKPTMIYRWGMETYHISGMSTTDTKEVAEKTDEHVKDRQKGNLWLRPNFKHDYYQQVLDLENSKYAKENSHNCSVAD